MRALFRSQKSAPVPVHLPVHSDVPELRGAELASVYYARRMAGDFYDFIRVGPNRVLFGLMDAAGSLRILAPSSPPRSTLSELWERTCLLTEISMKLTR